MSDDFKSAAILHLLAETSYKSILVVNGWLPFNSIVALHCDNFFETNEAEIAGGCVCPAIKFELVIAFAPSEDSLNFIQNCRTKPNVEAVFVTCSRWSYNKPAVTTLKKLIGVDLLRTYKMAKNEMITTSFHKAEIVKYYCFPSIEAPELILSQPGFSDYRRYWVWTNNIYDRNIFSFVAEFILVCKLRSKILSPFTIFKVN